MAKEPENHNKPWTRSDDAKLRELARGNTPTRVMGLKLGRTPSSVQGRASEIGQTLKPVNQAPYGPRKK
jgi:hypothetical protein